jgi:hypothetical protein
VTFACEDTATVTRINPLAMLPGSETPAEYVRICPPCYDTLAQIYAASATVPTSMTSADRDAGVEMRRAPLPVTT